MNRQIRTFLNHHLGVVDFQYESIKKGGSDCSFYRVLLPDGKTFIFMNYGNEVEENAHWAGINRFMTNINVPVPLIIAFDYYMGTGKSFTVEPPVIACCNFKSKLFVLNIVFANKHVKAV